MCVLQFSLALPVFSCLFIPEEGKTYSSLVFTPHDRVHLLLLKVLGILPAGYTAEDWVMSMSVSYSGLK